MWSCGRSLAEQWSNLATLRSVAPEIIGLSIPMKVRTKCAGSADYQQVREAENQCHRIHGIHVTYSGQEVFELLVDDGIHWGRHRVPSEQEKDVNVPWESCKQQGRVNERERCKLVELCRISP